MKTVLLVAIFCLGLAHHDGAAVEGTAEDEVVASALVPNEEEVQAIEFALEDAVGNGRRLFVPIEAHLTASDDEGSVQPRAARSCTAAACRDICRRLGFPFSMCSGINRCICWRR